MAAEIDTFNKFGVGIRGDGAVVVLVPLRNGITKADAVLLAAWLLTLSGETEGEFIRVLNAVQGT